jgi:hypothetical protein
MALVIGRRSGGGGGGATLHSVSDKKKIWRRRGRSTVFVA